MPNDLQDPNAALREVITKAVDTFVYLYNDQWFMPEPFSVYLANAMIVDGVPRDKVPNPRLIYELFFKVHAELRENLPSIAEPILVVEQIPDDQFTETMQDLFPNQTQTYLHCNSFVIVAGEWIWNIGERLVPSLSPKEEDYYRKDGEPLGIAWGRWAKDLPLTRKLIQGFFDISNAFMEVVEASALRNRGYGSAEEFLATRGGKPAQELINRGMAVKNALEQAKKAYELECFIESTILCECLISRILNEAIEAQGGETSAKLLYLLKEFESLYAETEDDKLVLDEMHFWRKRRNQATHNYVTRLASEGEPALDALREQTRLTAERGIEIAEWFLFWRAQWALSHISLKI